MNGVSVCIHVMIAHEYNVNNGVNFMGRSKLLKCSTLNIKFSKHYRLSGRTSVHYTSKNYCIRLYLDQFDLLNPTLVCYRDDSIGC